MRQGCPLTAYLYILQAEPLAQTIRVSKSIKGIEMPLPINEGKIQARISMFADDTQLFHSSEKSIVESFRILDTYCKASGAQLNLKKTKGLFIGSWRNKKPTFKKIKWVENCDGLGAHFGYNINYEEIWMKKFAKFKSKLNDWKKRDLTIEGKKLLINSYVMSSMSYLVDVYTSNISSNFIKLTRELIRDFLWNGKTWRISQKSLALKRCHGGIELPDLDNYIECKKLKWLLRIHFNEASTWNTLGKYYLHAYDTISEVDNFIMNCTSIKSLNVNIPIFYKTCLDTWFKITSKSPTTQEAILSQNIFGNKNIVFKNNPIFYFHWTRSQISTIRDIWDDNMNDWKEGNVIFNQLNVKRNWISEYNKIKSCIPQNWKQILRDAHDGERQAKLTNPRELFLSPQFIMINEEEVDFQKLKQKDLFLACLYPTEHPKCIGVWNQIMDDELNINDVFLKMNVNLLNRKCADLHWKLLHGAVFSKKRLQAMHKSDGVCKVCKTNDETLIHLFYECNSANVCWTSVENLMFIVIGKPVLLDLKAVIFGIPRDHDVLDKHEIDCCNLFVTYAKWTLWKHRNNVRYNNSPTINGHDLCNQMVNECKKHVHLLKLSKHYYKIKDKTKTLLGKILDFQV